MYTPRWKFQGGAGEGGVQTKKPSVGEVPVWIFSFATQCKMSCQGDGMEWNGHIMVDKILGTNKALLTFSVDSFIQFEYKSFS